MHMDSPQASITPVSDNHSSHPIIFENQKTTVGRASSNQIQVYQGGVSRFHAVISVEDGRFVVKDLGSRNGTFINQKRISQAVLRDGDQIAFGNSTFLFRIENGNGEKPEQQVDSRSENNSIRIDTEFELSKFFVDDVATAARQFFEPQKGAETQSETLLLAHVLLWDLYKLTQNLQTAQGPNEILKSGLDLLFNALPSANRAVAMLVSEPRAKLEAQAVKHRNENPNESVISLNQSVLEKVLSDGIAIVSRSINENSDGSKSLVIDNLNSIICCPMKHPYSVNGVIYLEADNYNKAFTKFDRNFVMAVSEQLALSIANNQKESQIKSNLKMKSADHIVSDLAEKIINLLEDNVNAVDKLAEQIHEIGREDIKQNWFKIRDSLEKIANITEEMAVYTQIDSMNRQNIDVNSVVLSECAPFKNNLLTEGGRFDVDLSSDVPKWMINEIGLRRSLQVLLTNAIDALQGVEIGCIKVSTEIEDKDTLIIRVTDNGCGIRKDKLNQVFELFYTTKGAPYSGIGLAAVKKFMESQGGKISVVSQPEIGSVFSIVFLKTAPTDKF